MTDSTPPCRRPRAHRHTLTYVQPGHPARRRTTTGDRCNSLYLWCTAAWALLTGLEPAIDGEPLTWPKARAYLEAHSKDGLARKALRMIEQKEN